ARSALAETRRVVGVLRDPGAGVDLTPIAGLADLDTLLEGVRASGLTVVAEPVSPDDLRGLTRDVDLAAYRVVQESLTNVLKHAGPGATATVMVERVPGALRVAVSDDGRGAQAMSDGLGNGIAGMRERVATTGGQLLAGPRTTGGFAVTATIPVVDQRERPPARPAPAPTAEGVFR
ncbi:MAG: ATP-binding protein, partial [Lapillicoccus sp.]